MHIGLFGGTFNPIHIGHLIIAESILNNLSLDRIIFIPAAIPPHKQNQTICDAKHRYKMIQLAIQNHSKLQVSDYELTQNKVEYTIDTVQAFQTKYPKDTLFFIIGADSLDEIHTWREPNQLLNMIQMIVVKRPGISIDEIPSKYREKVKWVDAPLIGISSSQIRQQIKEKKSIRFLTPPSVEDYILKNELYLKP